MNEVIFPSSVALQWDDQKVWAVRIKEAVLMWLKDPGKACCESFKSFSLQGL